MTARTQSSNGSSSAIDREPRDATAGPATEQPAMTTAKVRDAAHRAVDSVAAQVAEAERRLRDSASDNEQALRDAAGKATDRASELRDSARRFIDEKPLTAAGIAFVAGIVFSAWMRR